MAIFGGKQYSTLRAIGEKTRELSSAFACPDGHRCVAVLFEVRRKLDAGELSKPSFRAAPMKLPHFRPATRPHSWSALRSCATYSDAGLEGPQSAWARTRATRSTLRRRDTFLSLFATCAFFLSCAPSNSSSSAQPNEDEFGSNGSQTVSCGETRTFCHDRCASLDSNPLHCGRCGNACPGGTVCTLGSCQLECDVGLLPCGAGCANPFSDSEHCGSCGSACETGEDCISGQCECTRAEGCVPGDGLDGGSGAGGTPSVDPASGGSSSLGEGATGGAPAGEPGTGGVPAESDGVGGVASAGTPAQGDGAGGLASGGTPGGDGFGSGGAPLASGGFSSP